jgi:hypothetical protein
MTDDEALSEYETASGLSLTYWDAPEKNTDPWVHILDREARAWHELHSRKLLNGGRAIGTVILRQRRWNRRKRKCLLPFSVQKWTNKRISLAAVRGASSVQQRYAPVRPSTLRVGRNATAGVFTRADAAQEIPDCRLSHRRIPPIGSEEGASRALDRLTLIDGLSTFLLEPSACGSIYEASLEGGKR